MLQELYDIIIAESYLRIRLKNPKNRISNLFNKLIFLSRYHLHIQLIKKNRFDTCNLREFGWGWNRLKLPGCARAGDTIGV